MASLQEIAKLCGVSTATVSYVVNEGPRPVRAETRERVQKVIAQLGYHPNAHARGLRGMKTGTIGVVFPHPTVPFENSYFAPLLEGIVAMNTERRLVTMLFTGFTWEEAETSAPRLCDRRCDGFILVAPMRESKLVRDLVAREIPIVVVGTDPDDSRVPSVDADNREGGRLATSHLIDLGHRRIGFVSFSCHTTSNRERLEGYKQAMADAGLPLESEQILVLQENNRESQRAPIRRILSDPRSRPTALFCMQDGDAMHCIDTAMELGLRVPEDLSVVGFDDISTAENFHIPLTTVRQPVRLVGENAVSLLNEKIDDPTATATRILTDVLLIRRSSTGSPAIRHSRPTEGTLSTEKVK